MEVTVGEAGGRPRRVTMWWVVLNLLTNYTWKGPSERTLDDIYKNFKENLSSTLTYTHPDATIQQQARSQLRPARCLFYSTGAKYLKQFMRQYSFPFELSQNDWRTFIWFLQSKPILKKTVSQYLLQARRVLDFFNIPHLLHPGMLTKITFKRTKRTTPRREYCALEWNNVRKICNLSRTFSRNW